MSIPFVPTKLVGVAAGTAVGRVVISELFEVRRQTYEYAAWFRDHRLSPGAYDVLLGVQNHELWLAARVPSVITAACLVSGFGGVNYGPDRAGQAEVGNAAEYVLTLGRGRILRKWDEQKRWACGDIYLADFEVYNLNGATFQWFPQFSPEA